MESSYAETDIFSNKNGPRKSRARTDARDATCQTRDFPGYLAYPKGRPGLDTLPGDEDHLLFRGKLSAQDHESASFALPTVYASFIKNACA